MFLYVAAFNIRVKKRGKKKEFMLPFQNSFELLYYTFKHFARICSEVLASAGWTLRRQCASSINYKAVFSIPK